MNKNISKNIENFFNEIEQLNDFKDNKDIIEKLKEVYLKVNKGREKNNSKFLIIRDEDNINNKKISLAFKFNSDELLFDDK